MLANAGAGSVLETVAVETLVRLDEVPNIPAERLERWFLRQTSREVEPLEWDAGQARLEACRVVTLQPTGQQWLFDRVRMRTDPDDVRSVALAVLKQRAEATLELERWDFMSGELCRSIVDVD